VPKTEHVHAGPGAQTFEQAKWLQRMRFFEFSTAKAPLYYCDYLSNLSTLLNTTDTASMDISALQQRLRRFSDDRDWQPYQTPKNLAMAMTVEAAELLEIFQWLTPEQSFALSDDQRRHLGEELSDVLLYLVQIADHGGVDLEAAVERKLAMNAVKHPPKTRS
jgi:NTP pyrophosphatase (non-canonical NTP hydrolase)